MSKQNILVIIYISFLFLSCKENKTSVVVDKIKFNNNWAFIRIENQNVDSLFFEKKIDTKNWDAVQLPHTTKVEPKIVNNQWQGISWYRKNFKLTNEMKNKKLFFKFEGAMNIAEVWVNEKKLIKHQGGYLPFVVDFTEVADFENENTIAVKLNNEDNPVTGPKPLKTLDFNGTFGDCIMHPDLIEILHHQLDLNHLFL